MSNGKDPPDDQSGTPSPIEVLRKKFGPDDPRAFALSLDELKSYQHSEHGSNTLIEQPEENSSNSPGDAGPDFHSDRESYRYQVSGEVARGGMGIILNVFDKEGQAYFTMKMVKGSSLADSIKERLEKQDIPEVHRLTEILSTFLKICDGIAFAHSRGIIHRALKSYMVKKKINICPFIDLLMWRARYNGGVQIKPDFVSSDYSEPLFSLAFSPDGRTMAVGGKHDRVFLMDTVTRERTAILKGHKSPIECLDFNFNGTLLAAGASDGMITIWNMQDRKIEAHLEDPFLSDPLAHARSVRSLVFSPDGRLLATGCDDATVKLVDVKTLQIVRIFDKANTRIASVEFSPNGRFLAVAGKNPQPLLWEMDTGRVITLPPEHQKSVCSISFNHDGSLLATSDQAGIIKIWDLARFESRLTLYAHFGAVETVSFSPDGAILASGSSDTSLKLWDVETGECLLTLDEHASIVNTIDFSPDGTRLISGSEDGTLKIWKFEQSLKPLRL